MPHFRKAPIVCRGKRPLARACPYDGLPLEWTDDDVVAEFAEVTKKLAELEEGGVDVPESS